MKTKLGKLNLIVGILILSGCATETRYVYQDQESYGHALDNEIKRSQLLLMQEQMRANAAASFHRSSVAGNKLACMMESAACIKDDK